MDTVTNSHFVPTIIVAAGLALASSGCGKFNHQADAESKTAVQVVTWMKIHDAQVSAPPVTNLAQLFPVMKHGYPYKEHYDLQRFGKSSGFTNSLSEKYVFFWPRVTHKSFEGEVLCITSQPFRWYRDGLHRIYIAQEENNYIVRSVPDEVAQQLFREAKPMIVPLGEVKPPPPPPPEVQEYIHPSMNQRYERFVWNLAGTLGQDSSNGVRWMLGIGAVVIVAALGFIVFRGMRPRANKSDH